MLIYNLEIQFAFGRIGIDTYKGSVDPKMNIHESVDIDTKLPELALSSSFPVIEDIDASHCWADMGQPKLFSAIPVWYNEAKQYALEYIGSKAASGDALAAIEKGISIGDIVERESYPETPEVNVKAAPKTPPKITFKMGKVNANFLQGSVKVNSSDKPVTIDYERANVNIYLEQNPYITVKAVPTGKNIDKIA
jgi:hypothetical protein